MNISIHIAVAATLSLFSAVTSYAQEAQKEPTACESDSHYSEFDFWLGNWDVYVGEQKAGENIVTKEEGGCLVLEKWTDATGGTGQSYNFYNPKTQEWRQIWVSNYMTIDYVGGLTEDGSMELAGEITYFQNQKSSRFLGRWTKQEDGTVRQYFEQFSDEKGEMVPIFTGIYHPNN